MKSIYRHIILALCIILASCSKDEAILVPDRPMKGDIQIIGAVMDFDNKTVGTKALGSEENEESLITEMAMFIFDKSGNSVTSGPVVIKNYNTNPDAFMIEIGDGEKGIIGTLNGQKYEYSKTGADLDKCEIYIVANAEHYRKTDGSGNEVSVYDGITTLDKLLDQTLPLQGFEMPRNNGKKVGFPMIGTTNDGTTFNLLDAGANENTIATIPLRKLYSKVVVNISVHADQVSQEHTPKFELIRWKVMDSPKQVKFGSDRSGYVEDYENSPETNSATNQSITHTDSEILEAEPSDIISFTFYMPEHIVTPEGDFEYPDGILDNEKQRFKPALLGTGQKGTYVQIEGTYYDHHGQIKQATYRLYLGQNSTDDFKIIRNQQLNNYITIRGMTNSTSAIGPNGETNISVDHRVDVVNEGLSIAIERETLMDAHFEFRPVDVTLSPHSSLTVSIPDEEDRSWIAIEKSQPSGDSHVSGVGIRKYFTTNLISALTTTDNSEDDAGPVLTYENNSSEPQKYRFWIYVDENPNVYDKTGHGKATGEGGTYTVSDTESRFGNVQFVYTDTDAGITKTIDYNIEQRNLWRIWNGDWDPATSTPQPTRYYDIEYHEEYLYNYAADDPYGQTTDGMVWGLDGITFSGNMGEGLKTQAVVIETSGWSSDIISDIINSASPFYDFYLPREAKEISTSLVKAENEFAGKRFSNGIIDSDPDGSGTYTRIGEIRRVLNDTPASAIEYCLHKNRRNSDGIVENRNWYLPAIDEIEQIMVGGYSDFAVFQNKEYWSCQPSFHKNHFLYSSTLLSDKDFKGDYYYENSFGARATSALFIGTDANGEAQYNYAGSGATNNGYYQSLEISYGENQSSNSTHTIPSGGRDIRYWDGTREYWIIPVYTTIHLNQITYDIGYNTREDDINRVRCVYRSGTN